MRRTWAQIGCLLAEIDEAKYWQQDSASFTAWMSSHAEVFGVGLTVLWAHLRMVRYYRNVMLDELKAWKIEAPDNAHDLSEVVKCDLMEVYSKIANVAPDDVKRALAKKVMTGTARRNELRATWHAYRDQGLIVPGRKGRISAEKLVVAKSRAGKVSDANFMAALTLDKQWFARDEQCPAVYKILQQIDLKSVGVAFDMVILIKYAEDRLQLHGVDVLRSGLPNYKQLLEKRKYIDHMWLALPSNFDQKWSDRIPQNVGTLKLDGTKVMAVKGNVGAPESEPTASSLLVTACCLLEK